MFERRSLIQGWLASGGRDGADGRRTIEFREVHGWHLALATALPGAHVTLPTALADLWPGLGEATAATAGSAQGRSCFVTAPGQIWLVTGDASDLAALTGLLPGTQGTVVDLSHSRVRLSVGGPAVADVLAKVIAVDLDAGAFPVGAYAQTAMHHCPVLLHRVAADRYELYLPGTFARSLVEWLADASLPVGYEIGPDLPSNRT